MLHSGQEAALQVISVMSKIRICPRNSAQTARVPTSAMSMTESVEGSAHCFRQVQLTGMLVDAPVHVSRARDMDSRNDTHDLDARNDQGSSTSTTRISVENEVALVGGAKHRHVDPPAGARVD